jgi:CubicO group peptidase (beta-lactamase class C family)
MTGARRGRSTLLALLFALAPAASLAFPADAEVREMLRQRIEVSRRGVGIVVGLVDEKGSRIVAYGPPRRGNDELLTGDSVFEVGSVTKVFTSLLLSDMVEKGEVGLHDPIALYVPRSVRSPLAGDITLLHLSRHTSRLPSWPDNLRPADPIHYADGYTNAMMFEFLDGWRTRLPIGTQYLYSNYGAALLGELLALRAGTDFESALRARVLAPLAMESSGFALTPALRAAHALGHSSRGKPLPLGDVRGMLGSGALRSSANDLMRFVEANLGLRETSLAGAMRATHSTQADRQVPDLNMGLGWFRTNFVGTEITGHNGSTSGFRAYVGLDLAARRGVVVLANSIADAAIDNLGNHLLVPAIPLFVPSPPAERKRIQVDIQLLDQYVGTYKRKDNERDLVRFYREGEQLYVSNRVQSMRLYAESEKSFFTEDLENWGTFTRDAEGRVDGMDWLRDNWGERLIRIRSPEKR